MKLALIFFALVTSTAAQTCPLGAKEDHMTIQRVMRNLGRFIMPAEMISLRSVNVYEVITDQQLEEAIAKLNLVISCAQAVIDQSTGDMVPMHARRFEAEKLKTYMDDLVFYMDEFQEELLTYQNLFIVELAKEKSLRNFTAIQKQTKRQDIFIDRAHKILMD